MYMYVPETHPITKTVFHEREDFAHVYKVHACSLSLPCMQFSHIICNVCACTHISVSPKSGQLMNVIKHLVWILFWGNPCTCTINLKFSFPVVNFQICCICMYTLKRTLTMYTYAHVHVHHACVCILCRELLIALDVGVHLTCNLTVLLKLSMTNHLG